MTTRTVDSGYFSDKGPYRQRNEDVALASPTEGIFIVADGLGGAAAGDRASRVATQALSLMLREPDPPLQLIEELLPEGESRSALEEMIRSEGDSRKPSSRLRIGFLVAHCGVLAEARNSNCVGMATAMVVAWHHDDTVWIGHVGDCRAYAHLDGELTLLTQDHSLSKALEGRKSLPRGAADSAFLRSRLTQVVGGECAPTPDLREWKPSPGAELLLCSDGVWGVLGESDLLRHLSHGIPADNACQELVGAAIKAGSRDNATALLVRF